MAISSRLYALFGAPFKGPDSGAPKLTNMRYVHILSRQRRENYDSKEGKIESKAGDGDPVPIFPVSPPVRIEWVSLPL